MRDLMIDIETLDTAPTALVLSVGAVQFDTRNQRIGDSRYWSLSFRGQENRTTSAETMRWWVDQSQASREAAFAGEHSPYDALTSLHGWVQDADRVWARGPAFDLGIMNSLAQDVFNQPRFYLFPWHKWRDERSCKDMLGRFMPIREGVHHNALDDALFQTQVVLEAFRRVGAYTQT